MDIKKALQEWKNNNPIKRYRKCEGLSQSDVAAIMGVSGYTIQRWEEGAVNPSCENVDKLSRLIEGFSDQWSEWINNKPKL